MGVTIHLTQNKNLNLNQ